MKRSTRILKRLFDLAASITALLVSAPLWAFVTLVILFDDGRPILYKQERVGKDGRPFMLFKFRTMRKGSDSTTRLTPTVDYRITASGRILRKSHFDEIPQLLNVLYGDMSLVGPRPEVPEFVELADSRWQKALSVRPGLTYTGTLYFRRQGDILGKHEDYVKYYREDLLPVKLEFAGRYVDEATIWSDIRVIFATAGDILRPGRHSVSRADQLRRP